MAFLILLFGPALLIGGILFAIPLDKFDIHTPSRKSFFLMALFVPLLALILWVFRYDLGLWNLYDTLSFCAPPFLIGIAGVFLRSALRTPQKVYVEQLFAWALSLALVGYFLYRTATIGMLVLVFLLFFFIAAAGVVIVMTAWMLWTLPGKRKLAALLNLLVASLVLCLSTGTGLMEVPEFITQENGTIIAHALEQYYQDTNAYPATLEGLIPLYLTELPEAVTTQGTGWLYTSELDGYTLGYWYWADGNCTELCKYASTQPSWSCDSVCSPEGWKPFALVVTPTPLPSESANPASTY